MSHTKFRWNLGRHPAAAALASEVVIEVVRMACLGNRCRIVAIIKTNFYQEGSKKGPHKFPETPKCQDVGEDAGLRGGGGRL